MTIRLYDRFDHNFTCAVYDNVDWVDNDTIYFTDGTEQKLDNEFEAWEEIEES